MGFACLRCGTAYPVGDYPTGCPSCLTGGFPFSLQAHYRPSANGQVPFRRRGMLRYGDRLPYRAFATLGEGDTPLLEQKELADRLAIAVLYVKCEYQGPTGSHKDSMSCLAMPRAVDTGANGCRGVEWECRGFARGLCERCRPQMRLVATPSLHPHYRRAIARLGVEIATVEHALGRLRYVTEQVRDRD